MTVILTTHYIEEAEQLADRVGVINNGEVIIVEEKDKLMRDIGKKQLMLHLYDELDGRFPRAVTVRSGARRGPSLTDVQLRHQG